MTPEKRIQNKIIAYLKKLEKEGKPIYVERRQAGGFSYKMGIADLYAIVNGLHIEIEVKRPGGSLRPMQEKWRDQCLAKNIFWICEDNEDLSDLKIFINYLLLSKNSIQYKYININKGAINE